MVYFLFSFSDLIEDAETKFKMGWLAIGLFFTNFAINLGFIFISSSLKIYYKAREVF